MTYDLVRNNLPVMLYFKCSKCTKFDMNPLFDCNDSYTDQLYTNINNIISV